VPGAHRTTERNLRRSMTACFLSSGWLISAGELFRLHPKLLCHSGPLIAVIAVGREPTQLDKSSR